MVLSGLLEICERESVKKSECTLSCWLACPAARRRRESMCSVMLAGLFCCWPVGKREEEDRSDLLERPAWKRVKECYLVFL